MNNKKEITAIVHTAGSECGIKNISIINNKHRWYPGKIEMVDEDVAMRTFTFGSPIDMFLESFGFNYWEDKMKRPVQIIKMLILLITFLFFGTALKIIADNFWTEIQYQHALFIALPLIGWAWYYFKKLW